MRTEVKEKEKEEQRKGGREERERERGLEGGILFLFIIIYA